MDGLAWELRQATRRLLRSPTFTAAAVLTLALAIGANASIFAVVQRVVLNPLPYPDSGELIKLTHRVPRVATPSFEAIPLGIYYQYADRARTLEAVAAYQQDEMTLTGGGEPERIRVTRVTPSLISVLRVAPAHGRWVTEEEGTPGAPRAAVLSHAFWMRRYGGDRAILGRSVILNSTPTQIVGIMPPSYAFPDPRVDAWVAEQLTRSAGFGIFTHIAVARLRSGRTIEAARAEMTSLIADLPQTYGSSPLALSLAREKMPSTATTLKEAMVGNVSRALWILLASVGLLLLAACANVANLFLVRSEACQREVAVRRALGAGGRGIARYFLTESVLLSTAGGVIGWALAWGAVQILVQFGPSTLPRLEEVRLDAVAVAFTFVLSMLSAVAFGVIPLLHGPPLVSALHEQGRGNTASRSRHRARHVLMAGQVALALVLLVASGLMVRSFQQLRAVDPGFTAASALTFRVGLPDREYAARRAAVAAHQSILDRLSALPGVAAVSASTCLPLADRCFGNSVFVERRPDEQRPAARPNVAFRAVAAGYVEAMGMRIFRGRGLNRDDVERNEPNVVVNQAFADAYFPHQDPIGRRVASSRPPTLPPPAWLTIVGVVSDTPATTLADATPMPKLYMPMSIAGGPGIPLTDLVGPNISTMSYVVRSTTPPLGLVPAVRRAVDAIDPTLALAEVSTLQDRLDRASAYMAFTMVLLAIAASVALMLGTIGIYGVMSYIVSQRTGEIGVRLALGAEPGRVSGAIVRQGGLVALVGIAVGLATAFAGTRLIASLLYDVSPRDPSVFVTTACLVLCVAVLACWLPARRAAQLSPVEALRGE